MKIYTKTGDDGTTSLFRGGRVLKNNDRLEAYGTVDELNSILGMAVAELSDIELINTIKEIQNYLFTIGADLATVSESENKNITRLDNNFTLRLEQFIDKYDTKLPELKTFILPGGTKAASMLHLARTVCRRAERRVVQLAQNNDINNEVLIFINRLSDLLFVLSRYENFMNNTPDVIWAK
jgi:cob(I)alamin adenosyltransferase